MIAKISHGVILLCITAGMTSGNTASAQFPNWKAKPVRPRIDVIPPLGNNLPYSYRARMNRPSYLSGRIAYTIEPTSQEAMAWQRAWERGYYADHAPRMETHYMYPKPWEVLGVGAKPKRGENERAAFVPPENLPPGPADVDEAAEESESQTPEIPVMPEKLNTPSAEPVDLGEVGDDAQSLVPRFRVSSRPQTGFQSSLEVAPTIELSPILMIE